MDTGSGATSGPRRYTGPRRSPQELGPESAKDTGRDVSQVVAFVTSESQQLV